mmetsp:Transcript_108197/g.344931  ORF Transcript_108197/g.344931 Transcript_108197/m.344931 type:complete len:284 (+) Transcript_108197:48-899(+)
MENGRSASSCQCQPRCIERRRSGCPAALIFHAAPGRTHGKKDGPLVAPAHAQTVVHVGGADPTGRVHPAQAHAHGRQRSEPEPEGLEGDRQPLAIRHRRGAALDDQLPVQPQRAEGCHVVHLAARHVDALPGIAALQAQGSAQRPQLRQEGALQPLLVALLLQLRVRWAIVQQRPQPGDALRVGGDRAGLVVALLQAVDGGQQLSPVRQRAAPPLVREPPDVLPSRGGLPGQHPSGSGSGRRLEHTYRQQGQHQSRCGSPQRGTSAEHCWVAPARRWHGGGLR